MPGKETPPGSPWNNELLEKDEGDGIVDAPGVEGLVEEDLIEIEVDEMGAEEPEEDFSDGDDGNDMEENQDEPEEEGAAELEGRLPPAPLPEDNSEAQFDGHDKKSVFSVSCHPRNPDLVASGGEDDLCYIWKASDGSIVHKVDGFKDSVTNVAFNHDGMYLAMADMCGVVKVLKMGCKEVVWEFETSDIQWLGWHPGANVLFAATVDSELWMWKIPSGESKFFAGKGEKAECAQILPDGRRAFVGYGDGSLRLFDLKTGDTLHNFTGGGAHIASVASVAVRHDNNLMASGGVDGTAKLYNAMNGKNIGAFGCGSGRNVGGERMNAAKTEAEAGTSSEDTAEDEVNSKSTVEAMLFTKGELNFLVTGTLEGVVSIWDLGSQVSRQAISVGTGIVSMAWRNGHDNQLLVSTLDGTVRLVDIRSGKILADCSGHTDSILDFSQTSDGKRIVSASDDGLCKVFDIEKIVSEYV